MANSISHAALPYPIKGCRFTLEIPFLDSSGTPTDPVTPDTEVSIDGGSYADCTEEVTTITGSNGSGYITLTGDEMNGSMVMVTAKVASGPKPTIATLYPRVLPVYKSGTAIAGSASTIQLDAAASKLDNQYVGMIIRTTGGTGGGGGSGALGNQARIITAYVGSTQTATVVPNWETSPASGTTFEVLVTETALVHQVDAPSQPALVTSAAQSGTTTSFVDSALTQSDDYWKDALVVFTSGTLAGIARRIVRFEDTPNRVLFWPPTPVAVSTHSYQIWPAIPASRRSTVSFESTLSFGDNIASNHLDEPYQVLSLRGRLYLPAIVFSGGSAGLGAIVRFNNPQNDLSDYDVVTMPTDGVHKYATRMTYSSVTDRLYFSYLLGATNRLIVTELHPETLAFSDVIDDSTVTTDNSQWPALIALGAYLYVVLPGSTDSYVYKYALSGFTQSASTTLTGHPQSIYMITDGVDLFAVGGTASAVGWIARITPSSLANAVQAFPTGHNSPGIPAEANGHIWIPNSSGGTNGQLLRVNKYSLSDQLSLNVSSGTLTSVNLIDGVLWIIGSGPTFVTLYPSTLEISVNENFGNSTQSPTVVGTDGRFVYFIYEKGVGDLAMIARGSFIPAADVGGASAVAVWDAKRDDHIRAGTYGQSAQAAYLGAVSSATSTTLVLGTANYGQAASSHDDQYNGMILLIYAGTGVGQQRVITDYTGSSKTCTVETWATTPDNTSKVAILGV